MRARELTVSILLAGCLGCATFEYRTVQAEFEEAVLADNQELAPIIDRSESLYRHVAEELSAERIEALDPSLRANAWLIRSFSEWRSGAFSASRASAERGLAAGPSPRSRDDVLLHLVPALAIDAELMEAFADRGRVVDLVVYEDRFAPDFATALERVASAEGRFGPATPESTRYYVSYQRWRVIQNWREVISRLPDASARERARSAARVEGQSLSDAAAAARSAVPATHPLSHRM